MSDANQLPALSSLPGTTAYYLRELGLHRIPVRSWGEEVEMRRVAEMVDETAERLKQGRYKRIIDKLAEEHIYLQYYSGVKEAKNFSMPMSGDNESPGMVSKVKASYHPGGYVDPYPFKQIAKEVTEVQDTIETAIVDPASPNLHRLQRQLIGLKNNLRRLLPELDATIGVLDEVLGKSVEHPVTQSPLPTEIKMSTLQEQLTPTSKIKPRRNLGALAQLLDDDGEDDE